MCIVPGMENNPHIVTVLEGSTSDDLSVYFTDHAPTFRKVDADGTPVIMVDFTPKNGYSTKVGRPCSVPLSRVVMISQDRVAS